MDVSTLVSQMHDTLSTIHGTIASLNSLAHDARLDDLERQRDSAVAALRAAHGHESEALARQRDALRAEIAEKRRREDEERERRRRLEDEELAGQQQQQDAERERRLDDEARGVDDETDGLMAAVEEDARKQIDEGRERLRQLEEKRREINRLIDEQLNMPLPSAPSRRQRARGSTTAPVPVVVAQSKPQAPAPAVEHVGNPDVKAREGERENGAPNGVGEMGTSEAEKIASPQSLAEDRTSPPNSGNSTPQTKSLFGSWGKTVRGLVRRQGSDGVEQRENGSYPDEPRDEKGELRAHGGPPTEEEGGQVFGQAKDPPHHFDEVVHEVGGSAFASHGQFPETAASDPRGERNDESVGDYSGDVPENSTPEDTYEKQFDMSGAAAIPGTMTHGTEGDKSDGVSKKEAEGGEEEVAEKAGEIAIEEAETDTPTRPSSRHEGAEPTTSDAQLEDMPPGGAPTSAAFGPEEKHDENSPPSSPVTEIIPGPSASPVPKDEPQSDALAPTREAEEPVPEPHPQEHSHEGLADQEADDQTDTQVSVPDAETHPIPFDGAGHPHPERQVEYHKETDAYSVASSPMVASPRSEAETDGHTTLESVAPIPRSIPETPAEHVQEQHVGQDDDDDDIDSNVAAFRQSRHEQYQEYHAEGRQPPWDISHTGGHQETVSRQDVGAVREDARMGPVETHHEHFMPDGDHYVQEDAMQGEKNTPFDSASESQPFVTPLAGSSPADFHDSHSQVGGYELEDAHTTTVQGEGDLFDDSEEEEEEEEEEEDYYQEPAENYDDQVATQVITSAQLDEPRTAVPNAEQGGSSFDETHSEPVNHQEPGTPGPGFQAEDQPEDHHPDLELSQNPDVATPIAETPETPRSTHPPQGLANSRHNPERPHTPPQQVGSEAQDERPGLDPALIPRDVTDIPWHAREDSTPQSLRSQSTLSSSPFSESPFSSRGHPEPAIVDNSPGPAAHHGMLIARPRRDSQLADYEGLQINAKAVAAQWQRREPRPDEPATSRTRAGSGSPGGGTLFHKMRSIFEQGQTGAESPTQLTGGGVGTGRTMPWSGKGNPVRSKPLSGALLSGGRGADGVDSSEDEMTRQTRKEVDVATSERSALLAQGDQDDGHAA